LIALDAQIELRQGRRSRRLALDEFYLGYQRKDLRPGEFVSAVNIPRSPATQRMASYKISKRFDQDISAICASFAIRLEGQRVTAARLAFGGMAATPARARKAEAALLNHDWQPQTVEAAVLALSEDFHPLTDLRASSQYRLLVAGQLLRRFYRESQGENTLPLREISPVAELS
jgi:xanthine dehydrogenase small subunit